MWRLATIGVLVVVLGVGCASGTKSGGTVTHPLAIVMQATNAPDPNASYFSSRVQKLSGGRIKIVLAGTAYSSVDSRNEPRLVRALRSGKVQMAYIPARAWQQASPVTAFRALQAPLLVTSYPLLSRITTGPIGRSMLASLNSIGIVGLGLVPERLRRLLGRNPLDSAETLRGRRIRPATPTSDSALRALGAVPVTIDNSRAAAPALARRQIDGVESETISIENNNYMNYAHDLTANVALFAKATTLAIRRPLFERLSSADRSILLAAARATVAHADPAAAERHDMKELCGQRIRLVTATPSDLASLEPLALADYPTLERDPATRREIRAIERLKKTTPTVSDVPACPSPSPSQTVSHGAGPAGTYVVTLSQSEVTKASGGQADENWGAFRLILRSRRFRMSDQRPAGDLVQGASSGFSTGTYAIQGDRITFTVDDATGDTPIGRRSDRPVICRWSKYRNALTFQQLPAAARAKATARGLDAGGPPLLYVKPWQQRSPAKTAPAAPAAAFPTGTFETKITPADVSGVSGPAWWAHWETLTFTKDGKFTDVWFHPRRSDQPTTHARYFVHGTRMYQVSGQGVTDSFRWSYDRGALVITPLKTPNLDALGVLIYTAHPWRKIK